MRVFSAKGQPQWRRKVSIVGLPEGWGNVRDVEGAGEPREGGDDVGSLVGLSQEASSCRKVMMDQNPGCTWLEFSDQLEL